MIRALALLTIAAALPAGGAARACRGELVYLASSADGPAAGIVAARLDARTGRLCALGTRASVQGPSWLAAVPGWSVLYATSEKAGAAAPSVLAFRIEAATGALSALGGAPSGGAGTDYLSVDPRSRTVFATHWAGGAVSALPVDAAGVPGPPAAVAPGSGTGPARLQDEPRSHAALIDPSGRYLLATSFAGDAIAIFRFDPASRALVPHASQPVPPGSGPRHLAFGADGRTLYVVNQLTSTLAAFTWDKGAGTLRPLGSVPTLAPGFAGRNDAAGLVASADGRWLYVSNRGEDSVVVFAVAPGSRLPVERQRVASGGRTPRAITLDPTGRWLLVANQGSDVVTVFARDPRRGLLAATGQRLAVHLPAGAAFVEQR